MWDPHPSNQSDTIPLPALTGGLTLEDKLEDQMVGGVNRKNHRLKVLARLFLQTCPGDWERGQNVGLATGLRLVSQGQKPPMNTDVAAVVCYRSQMAHMADLMIRTFKLPKPNNETCLMWHREDWEKDARKRISNFSQRKKHVWDKFTASTFEPHPTPAQGPPFTRFQQYMTAAVVEADLTPGNTDVVVKDLVAYMNTAKKAVQDATVKNDDTRRRGRDWIKSIGRAVRRSLSPRKSISGQSYRERSNTATSRRSRAGSSASVMDNKPILTSPRASTESQRPSFDLVRRLSERKGKDSKK
ncbi:hypothetical protein CGCSCA4_v010130 [Colletotrichum siamense]|uniref:Uncharacterized protein n=1 Tax=Colletotrichum siamense TaxID=690259 RepID=A0A9P5K347_COLSI|nr:hypothetical protein CGCSCA4_v010130 [Colletotrichum siamense]KAF4857448.1 hypothetical protein CGCSCA2_v008357 [Colletotrichum siamense]